MNKNSLRKLANALEQDCMRGDDEKPIAFNMHFDRRLADDDIKEFCS
jgi:hypothetical protein